MNLIFLFLGISAFSQDTNTIIIKKQEPAFFQTKLDAVLKSLKEIDREANAKCPNDNFYNPSLTDLKVSVPSGPKNPNKEEGPYSICRYRATNSEQSTIVYLSNYVDLSSQQAEEQIAFLPDQIEFNILNHGTYIELSREGQIVQVPAFRAQVRHSQDHKLFPGVIFWSTGETLGGHFDCNEN
jgi:hypothetical protein